MVPGHGEIKTPASLELERKEKYTVVFSMPGYAEQTARITSGVSGWFLLGNLVFGGIPGWIIDLVSGSTGDLSPNDLHVDMTAAAASSGG
ncbi:MAG: hypothetical protein ACI89L_001989 [Phycisphaerales bacterium]|jgi:hypothetical protein